MEKYKITKLGSTDNPRSKNSTFGESRPYHVGYFTNPPEVGERFRLLGFDFYNKGIDTSPVTEIVDESTFKTLYSVYKLEKFEDE